MESPFEMKLSIANTSATEMQLQFVAELPEGVVVVNGMCIRNLGNLKPQATMVISVSLIPLDGGFQSIHGMSVVDALTEKMYEFGIIADVFVHNQETVERPPIMIDDSPDPGGVFPYPWTPWPDWCK